MMIRDGLGNDVKQIYSGVHLVGKLVEWGLGGLLRSIYDRLGFLSRGGLESRDLLGEFGVALVAFSERTFNGDGLIGSERHTVLAHGEALDVEDFAHERKGLEHGCGWLFML